MITDDIPGKRRKCSYRVKLLLLLACWSGARGALVCRESFDLRAEQPDLASVYEQKFRALRTALPRHAKLRYVGDQAPRVLEIVGLVDSYAQAIHRYVHTGQVPAGPGIDLGFTRHMGDLFLAEQVSNDTDLSVDEVRQTLIARVRAIQGGGRMALTRYVLAPHLVLPRLASELVVGDFAPDFDYGPLAQEEGLDLLEDFGRGAVLFRSRGK